jgi:hypothetical protein
MKMKFSTPFLVALGLVGLVPPSLAADYAALVAKGYRWVTIDGPYAYPSKEEARKIGSHAGSRSDLQRSDKGPSYYLIPGMVVLVVENDAASGLSRIRAGGITADLWTATRYLSSRPVRDTYGEIETPETSGIIPFESPRPSPGSNASPASAESPSPTVTPAKK